MRYLVVVLALMLGGCQTAGPVKHLGDSAVNSGECGFADITGDTYRLADKSKQYVTLFFFYDPTKEKIWQREISAYSALVSGGFKVVKTGLVTAEDKGAQRPFLAKYRYKQEEFNGDLLKRDKAFSTKVVTQGCDIYYLYGGTAKKSLMSSITKENGASLTDNDALALFGKESVSELNIDSKVEYDRFEKVYKVTTPRHKSMLLRGSVVESTREVSYIQLYADVTFLEKWGFVKNAVDTDGNYHKVTKIGSDTDCSSKVLGCVLTETIGVSLSRQFLEEKKTKGFEIKVYGAREAILNIPSKLILSFLAGLDEGKSKTKE